MQKLRFREKEKKIDWTEVREIIFCFAFYGGLLFWLGYTVYTDGFTELVCWIFAGLGCLILSLLAFSRTSMELGSAMGFWIFNMAIWLTFGGMASFRFIQWLLLGD